MEPWARPPVTVSRGSLETTLTIRKVLDTEYFDTSSLCPLTFVAKWFFHFRKASQMVFKHPD